MIQFQNYPIYVVYSKHWQEDNPGMAADFYVKGDDYMGDWVKTTGRALTEINEDSAPAYRQEAEEYETFVKSQLDIIASTKIGQLLLSLLNQNVKIYIIPDPDLYAQAITTPIKSAKEGGGIRIHINPSDWRGVFDDTLFHELVHALRFSTKRYSPKEIFSKAEGFISSEEFLASQMANIYRSCRGKKQLYLSYTYTPGVFYVKGDIYWAIMNDAELVMALKHFLTHEAFAGMVAKYNVDFNPFRDYAQIEKEALKLYGLNKFVNF